MRMIWVVAMGYVVARVFWEVDPETVQQSGSGCDNSIHVL